MLLNKKLLKKYLMYLLLFITGYLTASIINIKEYMNNGGNGGNGNNGNENENNEDENNKDENNENENSNGNGNGNTPESEFSVWVFIILGLCAALILWGYWDRRNGNI